MPRQSPDKPALPAPGSEGASKPLPGKGTGTGTGTGTPDRPDAASKPLLRLSEEIARLIGAFAERSVTLGEVVKVLRGRAYTLLLILMALPFCTPIPMPGLSMPFGLVIAVIGFRLALRKKPWLPRRLLDTRVPPRFFARLLGGARRLVRAIEYFLRPRWESLLQAGPLHHLYGAMICLSGLLMLLPFPIPFSNGLPALTVVLIGCAILEDDGYCIVAGGVSFLATLSFFAALFLGGAELTSWLRETFSGILSTDDPVSPFP